MLLWYEALWIKASTKYILLTAEKGELSQSWRGKNVLKKKEAMRGNMQWEMDRGQAEGVMEGNQMHSLQWKEEAFQSEGNKDGGEHPGRKEELTW